MFYMQKTLSEHNDRIHRSVYARFDDKAFSSEGRIFLFKFKV